MIYPEDHGGNVPNSDLYLNVVKMLITTSILPPLLQIRHLSQKNVRLLPAIGYNYVKVLICGEISNKCHDHAVKIIQ